MRPQPPGLLSVTICETDRVVKIPDCSPGQQTGPGKCRLYFSRKLRSFSVCSMMLHICCRSVCGGEFNPIFSHLLGEQHQRQRTEQTDKQGWMCSGAVLELGGELDQMVEEDASETG